VPPLRLSAAADDPRTVAPFAPRAREARRLRGWLAPAAAAAVVLAVAVSLVLIRNIQNGRVVPPAGSPAAPAAGVPGYYVQLDQGAGAAPASGRAPANGLLVAGTFTGKKVAVVAPPKGSTFLAVTGAADDRAFVAEATGFPRDNATGAARDATWYLLALAPGSRSPTRLTRLPIPATIDAGSVGAAVLSASGRELAVSYTLGATTVLRIYSVATGKMLNHWSASGQPQASFDLLDPGSQSNSYLSWVDGDRAIAFSTDTVVGKPHQPPQQARDELAVRVLDVTAGGGSLMGDSRVVWSRSDTPFIAYQTRPVCGANGATVPLLAANGKTVVCAATAGITSVPGGSPQARRTQVRLVWLAFSTSSPGAARTLYKVSISSTGQGIADINDVRWAAASGSTMIIDWAVGPAGPGAVPPAHFGLVRDGTFTPLPAPPGTNVYSLTSQAAIAW
jgi:hypothetical protein